MLKASLTKRTCMNWLIKEIYSTGKVQDSEGQEFSLADCIDPAKGNSLLKLYTKIHISKEH
jgi:hypothetical protein